MAARWTTEPTPCRARATIAGSRRSPRMNSNRGWVQQQSSGSPPCISASTTRTRQPLASIIGTSMEPMYPAPPVTSTTLELAMGHHVLGKRVVAVPPDVDPRLHDGEADDPVPLGEQPVDEIGHVVAAALGDVREGRRLDEVHARVHQVGEPRLLLQPVDAVPV